MKSISENSICIAVTVILIMITGCDSENYSPVVGRWEGYDSDRGKLKFIFKADQTVTASREKGGEKLATIKGSYTLSGNRISGKLNGISFSGILSVNKIKGEWVKEGPIKFELARIEEKGKQS